ncbi:MAG: OmpH family outer membrane protein [Gemmatimonadales bacterium]|nr:MAG: OmpH family outer membrane protein [Gemmatimonadales bacterium]
MHLRSFVLAGLVLLVSAAAVEAQTPRIGYIDSQAILQEAPGAQEAQAEFERDMQGYQDEIQRMGEELERLITAYQQQERTLSPEARQRREDEIRQKEFEYQQRIEQMELEAAQRRQQLVEPILDRMSGAIEEIRAEGQYTMIFDVASRAIIAADPELDLTTQVLQRLRERAGSEDR